MKRFALPILVLAVSACARAPELRYYTLDMSSSTERSPKYNIEIDRLRPTEPLTRKDILIKKTSTQIEYYALDHWAADVGELVTEKLKAELGARRIGQETLTLNGTILAFEQVDVPGGAEASIKIDLELRKPGGSRYDEPFLGKVYEVRLPAEAAAPDAIVNALSKGLEEIAGEIVRDVNDR
jgi:ABC-type uncharacterized transport system auxiliary subunit